MQRRSARLKDKPHQPSYVDNEVDMDIELDDEPDNSECEVALVAETRRVPKSRARKRKSEAGLNVDGEEEQVEEQPKAKKLRGNRGTLRLFLDMPTDILFEVLGRLEPLDLLSVAQTTKPVRIILMSKTSLSVWMRSFNNIVPTPPPCPDSMSYPEYADFAFGRTCHLCQRKLGAMCLYTSWRAKIRTCSRCLEDTSMFIEESHLSSVVSEDYPVALAKLLPAVSGPSLSGSRTKTVLHYIRPFHEQWKDEYSDLPDNLEEAWITAKIEEAVLERKKLATYVTWNDKWREASHQQQSMLVEDRKSRIVEKLKEMGWEDELKKIPQDEQPQNDPQLAKALQKEITPRVLRNLETRLTLLMKTAQAKRILRDEAEVARKRITFLKVILDLYATTQPADLFNPTAADLYGDNILRPMLADADTDLASLTDERTHTICTAVQESIERWHRKADRILLRILDASFVKYGVQPFDYDRSSILQLASIAFQCTRCSAFMTTERIKTHECLRQDKYSSILDSTLTVMKKSVECLPWNTHNWIQANIPILKQLADALRECGIDPKEVTADILDELDVVFECVEHSNEQTGRCTMGWSSLCRHLFTFTHKHLGSGTKRTFIPLDDETAAEVRLRLDESRERHFAKHRGKISICVRCRRKDTVVATRKHIRAEYGISEPAMDEDMVILPEVTSPDRMFWLWPPRHPDEIKAIQALTHPNDTSQTQA